MSPHIGIVGAGVIGLCLADALTRLDASASVTVFERDEAASGATRYAGAIDIPYAHTGHHRAWVESARHWWRELDRSGPPMEAATSVPRTPLPFAWLTRDEPAARRLEDNLVVPLRPLPGAGLAQGAWHLRAGSTGWSGEAHVIDPRALCTILLARLASTGRVRVFTQRRVTGIDPCRDGLRIRTPGARDTQVDRCVVAAGPWLPGFAGPLGAWAAAQGVRTKRVFGLRFVLADGVRAHYGVGSAEEGIFFFPVGGGEYAMSVKHDVWDVPPSEGVPTAAVLGRAASFLDDLVGCGNWRLTRTRVFTDTYTADAVPRISRLNPTNGLFVMTGLHGSGVRLAPGIASSAAESVLAI
ncbi:NAD(P)/FAD-dependent oxidoreductase [Streptomyces sp. NPDC059456]|uniref:NAD(P)/FAD-dependent oxidoreductase n=1 Tax=Streptomyces sp. NPDC059456 TaxID=3346838 RepID=UPI0036C5E174